VQHLNIDMKKIVYFAAFTLFLESCYNKRMVDSGTYQCEVLSDSALYSNTSCVCQRIDFVSSEDAIIYYKSGITGNAKIVQDDNGSLIVVHSKFVYNNLILKIAQGNSILIGRGYRFVKSKN